MNIPGYKDPKNYIPRIYVDVKLIIRCSSWPEGATQTATGHLQQDGTWFIQGFEGTCFSVLGWADIDNPHGQSTETL